MLYFRLLIPVLLILSIDYLPSVAYFLECGHFIILFILYIFSLSSHSHRV